MRDRIQSLWIGSELSTMERLSISSFLSHGHPYHLYVYEDVGAVPAGAAIEDAAAILPASEIFRYRSGGSYAGFANSFRYKLLLERGGWWADLDVVCVRPFDFDQEHVFASELDGDRRVVTNAVIKAPAASEVMASAWRTCRKKDPRKLVWGETGPRLLTAAVRELALEDRVQPHTTFCPLSFPSWRRAIETGVEWTFDDATRAVHLWHERWRTSDLDKDAPYPADCLYERLKRRYLSAEEKDPSHRRDDPRPC